MSWRKVDDRHEFVVTDNILIVVKPHFDKISGTGYKATMCGREMNLASGDSLEEIKNYLVHRLHKFY